MSAPVDERSPCGDSALGEDGAVEHLVLEKELRHEMAAEAGQHRYGVSTNSSRAPR